MAQLFPGFLLPGTRRDLAQWLRANRRRFALALCCRWTWDGEEEKRTYFSRLPQKPFADYNTQKSSFFLDVETTPF